MNGIVKTRATPRISKINRVSNTITLFEQNNNSLFSKILSRNKFKKHFWSLKAKQNHSLSYHSRTCRQPVMFRLHPMLILHMATPTFISQATPTFISHGLLCAGSNTNDQTVKVLLQPSMYSNPSLFGPTFDRFVARHPIATILLGITSSVACIVWTRCIFPIDSGSGGLNYYVGSALGVLLTWFSLMTILHGIANAV